VKRYGANITLLGRSGAQSGFGVDVGVDGGEVGVAGGEGGGGGQPGNCSLFGIYRTANVWETGAMPLDEALESLAQVLADLHLRTAVVAGDDVEHSCRFDLIIDTDREPLRLDVKYYALVDAARASQLTRRDDPTRPGPHDLLVVGDRIVELARDQFRRAGISWFDLRGHLFVTGPGLRVDTATARFTRGLARRQPLSGRTGLGTAVDILLHQPAHVAVRETARRIDAAASSVSVAVAALRDEGLVDGRGVPDLPALFTATAGVWKADWVPVETYPHPNGALRNPALKLGFDVPQAAGWALTGDVAAASLGAPIGLTSGAAPDFYVPYASAHRLAVSILGHARSSAQPAARLALAPVPAACEHRLDVSETSNEHWLLSRPLFVALELAQDPARGAEILRDWKPRGGGRVW
jgi:hypothetical protein